jgi:HAE1 family hydrophobic/amphiphilic exporter-1
VADTVAAPIEQQVNGVDRMIYMESTSASDGSYTLNVSFEVGTNVDIASVLVQNRVAIALAQLPDEVRRQGVTTKKVSTSIVSVLALTPKDPARSAEFSDLFLANYLLIHVNDEVKRIPGVGDTFIRPGKDYGMRVWLDPDKLTARGLTTVDVNNALREQNVQVAAGRDRPAALAGRAGLPVHGHHAGPAPDARAVREHHRAGGRQPHRLPARRRARRARGARVRHAGRVDGCRRR